MSFKLDPRVQPMMHNRAPHERFLIVAVCTILQSLDSKGRLLDSVLETIGGGSPDWTEIVAGQPLLNFNGKTAAQLRQEFRNHPDPDSMVRAVRKALKARGIKMDEGAGAPPAADESQPPTVGVPSPQNTGATEPIFAGHPLTWYAGKTSEELMAVEGLSSEDAAKIQELLA